MNKNIIIACIIWITLTVVSFGWNYTQAIIHRFDLSMQTARSFFLQVVLFREWNAAHGGVYVPSTAESPPNHYLKVPMRDIRVNRQLTLTLINPAYMTRQLSEISMKHNDVVFRITSLRPIRPANIATEMEKAALLEFESGVKEKGEIINSGKREGFFYMAPLITDETCLKCHASQGYKVGEIRGGISVNIPYLPEIPLFMLVAGHISILLAGLTGIIFAGTRLSTAYSIIQKQASHDSLTGIHNRLSFTERIDSEFRRSRREKSELSLIMADIDNFKFFNDTYGHIKGDECLKKVATAIEKTLNRPGDFCARYGGEEFVIILPDTGIRGAKKVAEEIRQNVRNLNIPHEKSMPEFFVTLSLGLAYNSKNDITCYEDLIKTADTGLYLAKEKGRNRSEYLQTDSENV